MPWCSAWACCIIQHPKKCIQFPSLTSGAGRSSADLESGDNRARELSINPWHTEGCHHKETAVPISSLNVSDWNLEAHKRSSQMRLFCKIYLDCHSQWCALLRRYAALGLWLSASCHTISRSCFVNLSKRTRDMWREVARLKFWTTSPVNAIFRAQNFSKTKIRKVSYLKHLIQARIQ